MNLKHLKIIGSSHISQQSVKEVKQAFKIFEPEIVAVELDKNRLASLFDTKKRSNSPALIKKIGLFGYVFLLVAGYVQKKLGKLVNIDPGTEMKTAVILTRKNKVKLALIDQNIGITLARLSKVFNIGIIWRFIVDAFNSMLFPKREMERLGFSNLDLTKVPSEEVIDKMIGELENRYPEFYKVLIADRNKVMAANLMKILEDNPDKKVLAVIGAGHRKGMMDILKHNKVELSYSFSVDLG